MAECLGYGLLLLGSLLGCRYTKRKGCGFRYRKYLQAAVVIGLVCLAASVWEQIFLKPEPVQTLERNPVGTGTEEVLLSLDAEGVLKQQYPVTVEERRLTVEEAEHIFSSAEKELETLILGENESLETISSNLYLPRKLQEGAVEVSCYFDPYELVGPEGTILWENLDESLNENLNENQNLIEVTAEMKCQEYQAVHSFYIQLLPRKPGEEEALMKGVKETLDRENQKEGEAFVKLPSEYGGIALTWQRARETYAGKVFLLGSIVLIAGYVYSKEKAERERKAWNRRIILDYPEIVSRLSLLTGAGMTVSAAWGRIAAEYEKQREKRIVLYRPGYEEMLKTWHEMQDGIGEIQAYGNFGSRCGQPQYRKLSSVLMQNVRKGTKGMQQLLDAEAKEAFLQRKLYAKQLGEEAGTKMLLPMGIMLLVVFAILMLPAMQNLQL